MSTEKHFAKFLRSVRVQRGFTNVSEYVKKQGLDCISEMYYRDLESGRKALSLERAPALCKQLKTDPRLFYFYLLRDSLDEDVLKSFVQPVVEEIYESAQERQKQLESDRATLRRALEKTYLIGSMHTDKNMIAYFDENHELVPLLDFLFAVKSTSESELRTVMKRIGIKRDAQSVIEDFVNLGLVSVTGEAGQRTIYKNANELHFDYGDSEAGQRLREYIHVSECATTIRQARLKTPFEAGEGAFIHAGVTSIPKADYKRITDRIVDLIAEIHASAEPLDSGAKPFRFSFQIASRNEFLPVKFTSRG